MPPSKLPSVDLRVLGQRVRIEHERAALRNLLLVNFGALVATDSAANPDLVYSIRCSGQGFLIGSDYESLAPAAGQGELIYRLEKMLTIDLQKRRPDLLFLHAAALEWQGKVILLAADSGSGKSTTAWALLQHSFHYLSDELAPIDPETLEVFSYPHALCLKQPPPAPYDLPDATMYLGRTTHVPVSAMPASLAPSPLPLGAIFLVWHDAKRSEPELRRLSAAEASARLYVTTLNALAHENRGLSAIVRLAEKVPCYSLITAGLPETCMLVRDALT